MKYSRLAFLICSMAFLFVSCNKNDSPTQPSSFNKGEYTGTYSVTFKNYLNQSYSFSQSGSISLTLSDSTYSYNAIVAQTDSVLNDVGKYSIAAQKMTMNDQSWVYMNPGGHNSLYLMDTFSIQTTNNQFIISQENDFANWKLVLIPKQ